MAQDRIRKFELILIGGSSGSLEVIVRILSKLPGNFPLPILLVMHRGNTQDSLLEEVLQLKSSLPILEIEEKEPIRNSTVYLVPSDFHALIEKDRTFSLDYSEKLNYSRPSIDVTYSSAAEVYREALVAILLSGANDDGAAGMETVQANGGYCIVQDPDDAIVDHMPRHAMERIRPDAMLTADGMLNFMLALIEGSALL